MTDENTEGPVFSMHQSQKVQELRGFDTGNLEAGACDAKFNTCCFDGKLMLHSISMLQALQLLRNTFEKNLKISLKDF